MMSPPDALDGHALTSTIILQRGAHLKIPLSARCEFIIGFIFGHRWEKMIGKATDDV